MSPGNKKRLWVEFWALRPVISQVTGCPKLVGSRVRPARDVQRNKISVENYLSREFELQLGRERQLLPALISISGQNAERRLGQKTPG